MENKEKLNNILNTDNKELVLSEEELSAIYFYLSTTWDDMNQTDQAFWIDIINKLDPW